MDEKTQKYVNMVFEAKKAGKFIPVNKFMQKCKEDGVNFPEVLKETAKKGVWGVFR